MHDGSFGRARSLGENAEEPLTAPFSKEAAQAHARRWASALRASSQRAALLETALRKRRLDNGAETLNDVCIKSGALRGSSTLRQRHAREAAAAVREALVEALRQKVLVEEEEEEDESEDEEEGGDAPAEEVEDTLLGPNEVHHRQDRRKDHRPHRQDPGAARSVGRAHGSFGECGSEDPEED